MGSKMMHGREQIRFSLRFGALCVLALCLVKQTAADDVVATNVSTLKLKPQTSINGSAATLADVLSFADADPRLLDAIGAKPLVASKPAAPNARVVLDRSPHEI